MFGSSHSPAWNSHFSLFWEQKGIAFHLFKGSKSSIVLADASKPEIYKWGSKLLGKQRKFLWNYFWNYSWKCHVFIKLVGLRKEAEPIHFPSISDPEEEGSLSCFPPLYPAVSRQYDHLLVLIPGFILFASIFSQNRDICFTQLQIVKVKRSLHVLLPLVFIGWTLKIQWWRVFSTLAQAADFRVGAEYTEIKADSGSPLGQPSAWSWPMRPFIFFLSSLHRRARSSCFFLLEVLGFVRISFCTFLIGVWNLFHQLCSGQIFILGDIHLQAQNTLLHLQHP